MISVYTLHIVYAKHDTQLADELGQRDESGWKKSQFTIHIHDVVLNRPKYMHEKFKFSNKYRYCTHMFWFYVLS